MDNYYNLERAKQAGGLCDKLREAGLGHIELSLLKVLGRKMGKKTDIKTGEIENGCRAALETLEHETLLERKAIGRALGRLIDAGLITKKYDRCHHTELTKEGQRRKALGLSLVCPEKNNYQRQQMGAPRKDGNGQGQWKHCVYHLVPAVWDGVVFDSREVRELAPVSAEDKAVIDSIDLPVAVKAEASARVTKQQADEVFEGIKHYFAGHSTLASQSEKDARRSMNEACIELAQKALDLGDLNYADRFLWWLLHRRNEIFEKLMDGTIKNLGVSFGLLKYICELWDEFVPEKDDEIAGQDAPEDDWAYDESGYVDPTMDEDDDFGPTPVARAATPVPDFDDEDDPFHPVKREAVPAPKPTPKVVSVVAPVMAPPPVKPEYDANLELKALLRRIPTDQDEATFRLPEDHADELIDYLRTTFGEDCFISDGSARIAGHRANGFLREDRFFDPYAKERTMYDCLVSVVAHECKKSFAAVTRDFNLAIIMDPGITREEYKAWVGDGYSDFVSLSDMSSGSDHVFTKVSLHKGVTLPQFAEHLKNNPFTAPMPPSTTKSASAVLA